MRNNIKAFVAVVLVAMAVLVAASAYAEYDQSKDLTVLRVEVFLHPSFATQLEEGTISEYVEQLFADTSAIAFRDGINIVFRPVEITVLEDDPIVGDGTASGYRAEVREWYLATHTKDPEDVVIFFTSELIIGGLSGGDLCGPGSIPLILIGMDPYAGGLEVLLGAELANKLGMPDEHGFCPQFNDVPAEFTADGPINTCAPSPCVPNPNHHQVGGVTGYGYCSQYVASFCPTDVAGLNKPGRFCDLFRQKVDEATCLPREPVNTGFADPAPCVEDADVSCLNADRFAISVTWRDPRSGNTGVGNAKTLTADSGYFWFFNQDNVEILVKVLDGRPLNDHFWVFYASLTDVEFNLKVVDTDTGKVKFFTNPGYSMASEGDTSAFMQVAPITANSSELAGASASATTGEALLLLNGERFKVEVDWRDPRSGNTGVGNAKTLTADSGYFWFFNQDNVEIVVKVLEACAVNGYRWVFFGSLTDVEFDLYITDMETGERKTYRNEGFNMASRADTSAFACN